MVNQAVIDEGRDFFIHNVMPRIPYEQKRAVLDRYPNVQMHRAEGYVSLRDVPVVMLVALTGTGKTTTLAHVESLHEVHYRTDIPARREMADLLVIPTAQVLSGERVEPVSDRVERFRLTRTFAALMGSGGFALAYGWLHYAWDGVSPLLSDGIRGHEEISHVMSHFPAWQVIELWVDPLTRLVRLSGREDAFDHVSSTSTNDVSFLPLEYQQKTWELLAQGLISPHALPIMRAEAENYDLNPYSGQHERYHLIDTTTQSPELVAQSVVDLMGGAHGTR